MQIPVEWYTHMVPGAVFICALLPFWYDDLWGWINSAEKRSEAAIGAVIVFLVFAAYVVGFSENALMTLIGEKSQVHSFQREIAFNNFASSELIRKTVDGYNSMIFQRSLAASILMVAFSCLFRWFRKISEFRFLLFFIILICLCVLQSIQYYRFRESHQEFVEAIYSVAWESIGKRME